MICTACDNCLLARPTVTDFYHPPFNKTPHLKNCHFAYRTVIVKLKRIKYSHSIVVFSSFILRHLLVKRCLKLFKMFLDYYFMLRKITNMFCTIRFGQIHLNDIWLHVQENLIRRNKIKYKSFFPMFLFEIQERNSYKSNR